MIEYYHPRKIISREALNHFLGILISKTIEKAEPGLTGVITFTQRMTLQGGQYMLALGLTGFVNGELRAYHRLYDICEIQVLSDRNTVGIFDPESKISYADIHMEET